LAFLETNFATPVDRITSLLLEKMRNEEENHKKNHAGRGHEIKWDMPIYFSNRDEQPLNQNYKQQKRKENAMHALQDDYFAGYANVKMHNPINLNSEASSTGTRMTIGFWKAK
jgi:hypothetical protein